MTGCRGCRGAGGKQLERGEEPVQRRCHVTDGQHVGGDEELPEHQIGGSEQDMDRRGREGARTVTIRRAKAGRPG